jgi:ATP-dependent DNA ligase
VFLSNRTLKLRRRAFGLLWGNRADSYVDGYDLTACPLIARKAVLKRILPKGDAGRIRYTEHFNGSGDRLFGVIERMQLEGMVAKRKDSVYSGGRSRLWQKIKTSAGRTEMQERSEAWR